MSVTCIHVRVTSRWFRVRRARRLVWFWVIRVICLWGRAFILVTCVSVIWLRRRLFSWFACRWVTGAGFCLFMICPSFASIPGVLFDSYEDFLWVWWVQLPFWSVTAFCPHAVCPYFGFTTWVSWFHCSVVVFVHWTRLIVSCTCQDGGSTWTFRVIWLLFRVRIVLLRSLREVSWWVRMMSLIACCCWVWVYSRQ